MNTTAQLLLSSLLAYVVWSAVCLEINVRKARALKIPIIRIPFSMNNNVWVLVQPLVWKVFGYLPVPWSRYPNFVRFTNRNWNFLEKSRPTTLFGPVWALVSPGGVHMHFSDPDAIQDIFTRWRDFVRPIHKYQMLTVYGPSVFTVELDDWARHRRAMAAPFHEGTMQLVWDESLKQAGVMLQQWASLPDGAMTGLTLYRDLETVSLNVLAATAFRDSSGFKESTDQEQQGPNSGNTESYRDALAVVHKNVILLMMIPYRLLTGPWVPPKLRRIGQAATSLRQIMAQVVADDLTALRQGREGTGGTITSLVRAFDADDTMPDSSGDMSPKRRRKGGLSVDEVLGNTFVINVAGLDTTPNALSFALTLLAAHPEVQEWLHEEITTVFLPRPEEKEKIQGRDYALLFPQLKRCMAVMHETLRLYAPITSVPKVVTARGPQTLRVGARVLAIPSGVEIFPLLLGVQTNPQYWSDPYEWKPSRWIVRGWQGEETLLEPRKGIFFPWSGGPQYCIGRKFSQVETVAVLAFLFSFHRVRATARPGESAERARKRAQACVDDVNFEFLLKMNRPDEVGIEFVRRED